MAARRKSRSQSDGVPAGKILGAIVLLFVGCAAGYALRSYHPLPLPFESELVADKSSDNVADETLKDIVRTATDRAEKAESERDALRQELATLRSDQQKTEHELADMQIKSVLETPVRQ
ncbi:MAG TPA: hypothetical protein PKH51_02970 [Candidatus Sumerlaeota bacterium]|nr:hypothetical protein [Candidatus Sumerlaeota bacterium]